MAWIRLSQVPADQREEAIRQTHAHPLVKAAEARAREHHADRFGLHAREARALQALHDSGAAGELDAEIQGAIFGGAGATDPDIARLRAQLLTAELAIARVRTQTRVTAQTNAASFERRHPLDVAAAQERLKNPSLSLEQSIASTLQQRPELYDDAWTPASDEDAIAASAVTLSRPTLPAERQEVITKTASAPAATLASAAAALRSADPTLSEEQASARALEQDPSLYMPYDRYNEGGPRPRPEALTRSVAVTPNSRALDRAAAALRAADPKLSPEQAVARALEQDPTLYVG